MYTMARARFLALVPQMFRPSCVPLLLPSRARALASAVCPKLQFFNSVTQGSGQIPTYRVLDGVGIPIQGAELPGVRISLSTSALLIDLCRSPQSLLASCAFRFLRLA